MSTTLTVKGQVTIPKTIRDAMGLTPGTSIDFAVNQKGEVVLQKAATRRPL
jgi:antitoxin PrlF